MCSPARDQCQTYVIAHTPACTVAACSHCRNRISLWQEWCRSLAAMLPGENTVKYYDKTHAICTHWWKKSKNISHCKLNWQPNKFILQTLYSVFRYYILAVFYVLIKFCSATYRITDHLGAFHLLQYTLNTFTCIWGRSNLRLFECLIWSFFLSSKYTLFILLVHIIIL